MNHVQHFRIVAMFLNKEYLYIHTLPYETFSRCENKIQISHGEKVLSGFDISAAYPF